MSHPTRILIAAALVLLAGLGVVTVWGQAVGPATPPAATAARVAVVDLDRVIASLKEKQKLDADLADEQRKLTGENEERTKRIKDMQEDLSILSGDAKAAKQAELEQALFEHQAWGQYQQQRFGRMALINVQYLYRKMNSVVGEYAQANGYDLAVVSGPDIPDDVSNQQLLQQIIGTRRVLWHSDRIDITDQVITRMNNAFGGA